MKNLRYNIVYKGAILEDHDIETVKSRLVTKFNLSPEKADKLLNSDRAIVRKNLDEDMAKKYGAALKKAGLNVVLTKYVPASRPSPPTMDHPEPPITPLSAHKDKEMVITRTVPKKSLPFEFLGLGTEYFKIWIVNLIFSIATLGIYSAWAKVRRKQYFYGNTSLNGSSFEYLADPVNILKGQIIVAVFFGIYSVMSQLFPLAGMVISLLFIIILPWLVVRSLAFNARNSAYKNIRFGFNGTIKEAFKIYLLFPILVPLTLGILSPYAYFRNRKFVVENSSYGNVPFTFTASHKDYYTLFFKALIPLIIGLVITAITAWVFPPGGILISMVLYLYLFAYISVKSTNLFFNSTILERHEFEADLETKGYLILIVSNTLASVLTLGIFYPWAHIRAIQYKFDHLALIANGDLDNFVAQKQKEISALGDEAGDFFDLDIGL